MCTEHDLGYLKGVSSPARGGSSETSVDSEEGGDTPSLLKKYTHHFGKVEGKWRSLGKVRNKTGDSGGEKTQIQFFTLFPALIHFLSISIGDCLRGAVIYRVLNWNNSGHFSRLSEWWLSWEAWFFTISKGAEWRKWEERKSSEGLLKGHLKGVGPFPKWKLDLKGVLLRGDPRIGEGVQLVSLYILLQTP